MQKSLYLGKEGACFKGENNSFQLNAGFDREFAISSSVRSDQPHQRTHPGSERQSEQGAPRGFLLKMDIVRTSCGKWTSTEVP